ncbi:hypothetical protein L598_003900000180 [Mesorhizobium sp. J18]|uniref:hypothetical protein n=1 Tax=Mesorhizobium sp. J18 TaxID=935263 RepID=UPI001198F787|nr:hypothetical protein [Mesorhizobium sp. J18]TWG94109.1 hypothetical protein L598_003900000180 [Mesorhizobium sp. J18]
MVIEPEPGRPETCACPSQISKAALWLPDALPDACVDFFGDDGIVILPPDFIAIALAIPSALLSSEFRERVERLS